MYRTGLRTLGLGPDQVMHVTSHAWDVRGAKAAGLRGAYINRAGVAYYDPRLPPDVSVDSFIELAKHPALTGD